MTSAQLFDLFDSFEGQWVDLEDYFAGVECKTIAGSIQAPDVRKLFPVVEGVQYTVEWHGFGLSNGAGRIGAIGVGIQ